MNKEPFGEAGFTTRWCLESAEIDLLQRQIEEQWKQRLLSVRPDLQDQSLTIRDYHLLPISDEEHSRLWPKSERVLPAESARQVLDFSFLKSIREQIGEFSIAPVHDVPGREHSEEPEVYWRLVRPDRPTDIGPMHFDKQFHEVSATVFPADTVTVKLWLAIHCEPGKNGLRLEPGSHLQDWASSYDEVNGVKKPRLLNPPPGELIPAEPGRIIAFHERTVHGGELNRGKYTRVSAEITLGFPASLVRALA